MLAVPEPVFFSDAIFGRVYRLEGRALLSVGEVPPQLTAILPIVGGAVLIRYGISRTSALDDVIVPGSISPEAGVLLVGHEARRFVHEHYQQYPRANVTCLHLNGKSSQLPLCEIGFNTPVHVLAYSGPAATIPAAEVTGLLIKGHTDSVPPRLLQCLRVGNDLDQFVDL